MKTTLILIFGFFWITASAQDSTWQRSRLWKFSIDGARGVNYAPKTNDLNSLTELGQQYTYGFNIGYHSLYHLSTFHRIGIGLELNTTFFTSQVYFQNPQDEMYNPNPVQHDLGKVTNLYFAADIPLYYSGAMRFKNNNEFNLILGMKNRIIPGILHEFGNPKEVTVDQVEGTNHFHNTYNVDYSMERSRVVVFYNIGFAFNKFISREKGIHFFANVFIGGFNNGVNIYYRDFDNSENGVSWEYNGEDVLRLQLGMSHLSFGVGYNF